MMAANKHRYAPRDRKRSGYATRVRRLLDVSAAARDPYSPGSAVPVDDANRPPGACPGERTRRFVRWTLRHGKRLWAIALLLALPATAAVVHLYRNLSSDIEELLPQSAPSVVAMDELRARLPGLSSLGIVVAAPDAAAFPAALRLADDLAARIRGYPSTLVRNVRTGSGPERQFIEQHAAMFVETGDLAEIGARIQARRDWQSRKALGIAFDEEASPPPSTSATWRRSTRPGSTSSCCRKRARAETTARMPRGRPAGATPIRRPGSRWFWSRGRNRRPASTARSRSSTGSSATSARWGARGATRRACASASRGTSPPRSRS